MIIGYARCSAADQNPQRQLEVLEKEGCEKVFIDMLSGKNTNRPQLKAMLSFAREGDTIIVESISRLARNTRDLLAIIDNLTAKKVQIISKKEAIDTTTDTGKFMLTVFAAIAELERSYIKGRQAEGIAIAKKNGIYKGRKPIIYDEYLYETLYKQWKKREISQNYMAKRLGVSATTLYRINKKHAEEL
ncbi:MAG: recombinase family protein [Erysipelotrichaceae bacterium]|nr:recombinase family protein [Erysipelotrichaceae bacterium]